MTERTLTPDEQAELDLLVESSFKKDGSPRKDAKQEDLARIAELRGAAGIPSVAEPTENKPIVLDDIQAVVFMAKLPIVGFQRADSDIAFDLGDGHKITVGMIRQAKQLLGQ